MNAPGQSTDARMVAAIRAILAEFDWQTDDRQYALEAVEQIVGGGQVPAAGVLLTAAQLRIVLDALADAQTYREQEGSMPCTAFLRAEVPCPHCGARPGTSCRRQGRRAVHLGRWVRAYATGRITPRELEVLAGVLPVVFTIATPIPDGAR